MSAHTINRPVPRVLAMAVSLASRAFNTAPASEASEEIGCLPATAPRQIRPGDYNAPAAAFRRKPAGLRDGGAGNQAHHPAMEPGDRGRDPAACGARQGFGSVAGGRLGRDVGVVARRFVGPGCAAEAVALTR